MVQRVDMVRITNLNMFCNSQLIALNFLHPRYTFHSSSFISNAFLAALCVACVYAFFRYRAEKIAKKKAVETARVSMITKNLDNVTTNMEKNEKHRKAAAAAEAERRTAAAAAAAAKIKAAEDEKNEIAASKERVRKMRADVWKRLAGRFKVCSLSYFPPRLIP
jgi:hypothetical protein